MQIEIRILKKTAKEFRVDVRSLDIDCQGFERIYPHRQIKIARDGAGKLRFAKCRQVELVADLSDIEVSNLAGRPVSDALTRRVDRPAGPGRDLRVEKCRVIEARGADEHWILKSAGRVIRERQVRSHARNRDGWRKLPKIEVPRAPGKVKAVWLREILSRLPGIRHPYAVPVALLTSTRSTMSVPLYESLALRSRHRAREDRRT